MRIRNLMIVAAIFIVIYLFFQSESPAQRTQLFSETIQLDRRESSKVYTLTLKTPIQCRIAVQSTGKIDFALLPTMNDLAFPFGPYRYVEPFLALGVLSKTIEGNLAPGTYYLEINSGRYSSSADVSIEVSG